MPPVRIVVTAFDRASGSTMWSSSPSGADQASTAACTDRASVAWRSHTQSSVSSRIIARASRRPYMCGTGGVPQ